MPSGCCTAEFEAFQPGKTSAQASTPGTAKATGNIRYVKGYFTKLVDP
jgi:hypothetical protein